MRKTMTTAFLAGTMLAGAPAFAQDAAIVLPGAPGQPSQVIDAKKAIALATVGYTPADVMFMQAMIPHHQQAVEMARLVDTRTGDPAIRATAERILIAQADEMKFMSDWLSARSLPLSMGHDHAMHMMKGMASPEQMAALAAARGGDFDRLFLQLMIAHHDGALDMTDALLEAPGTAADPVLYAFTQEVLSDQRAEIKRMTSALASISTDPRSALKAGYMDAGEAALGVVKLASLPRPAGFFDPENPAGLRVPQAGDKGKPAEEGGEPNYVPRYPAMNFWNSDMAFSDGRLFVGSFHGYNIYDLDTDGVPSLATSVVCPGGQGDVSIVGDILVMSVESNSGRVDCGLQGVQQDVSKERFRGLRVFDISDISRPRQVAQVQTCRGSHTHSVVSDGSKDGKILVYNSGTAGVRDAAELAGCNNGLPGDPNTSRFSIDIIEIPVADPAKARIVSSPRIFADLETGAVAGLWRGGEHGEGTQDTAVTDQCHDITVYPALGIAAGACSGNGLLLDISDPRNPKRLAAVTDPGFAYWHSATFNNDGTKVIFTDEWGGGVQPRCRAQDPRSWGADAIYRIEGKALVHEGGYKLPAVQDELQNCVAHNGMIIPVPGRDLFAQAWYQGGMSIMDFTDGSKAHEIAYFDRGPIDAVQGGDGGYWSTYWYKGRLYASAMLRGLDVFRLAPTANLTANEIAAAEMAITPKTVNPQDQFALTWPDHPVIGMAYVDQLAREGAIDHGRHAELLAILEAARSPVEGGAKDKGVAARLAAAANSLPPATGGNAKRVAALAALMERLAKTLG